MISTCASCSSELLLFPCPAAKASLFQDSFLPSLAVVIMLPLKKPCCHNSPCRAAALTSCSSHLGLLAWAEEEKQQGEGSVGQPGAAQQFWAPPVEDVPAEATFPMALCANHFWRHRTPWQRDIPPVPEHVPSAAKPLGGSRSVSEPPRESVFVLRFGCGGYVGGLLVCLKAWCVLSRAPRVIRVRFAQTLVKG